MEDVDHDPLDDLTEKEILWETYQEIKGVHRIAKLFAAALVIWIVLATIGVVVTVTNNSRRAAERDADAYVECVLAGRSNCR